MGFIAIINWKDEKRQKLSSKTRLLTIWAKPISRRHRTVPLISQNSGGPVVQENSSVWNLNMKVIQFTGPVIRIHFLIVRRYRQALEFGSHFTVCSEYEIPLSKMMKKYKKCTKIYRPSRVFWAARLANQSEQSRQYSSGTLKLVLT